MDLSAMQSGPPAAEGGILASVLSTNTGSAAGPLGLFESLLEDALGQAAPAMPAVAASNESLAPVDGNVGVDGNAGSGGDAANPVAGQAKDIGHKKADSKSPGGNNAGTAALYALTMGPVPAEPLQKLNQPALALVRTSQAARSQLVSDVQVPGAPEGKMPTSGRPRSREPQSGASFPTTENPVPRLQFPPDTEVPAAKAAQSPVGQGVGALAQELSARKPVPKVVEHSKKNDEQSLEAPVSNGPPSGNTQIQTATPVAEPSSQNTSEPLPPNEAQKAVAKVPDGAALATATPFAIATSPSQSRINGAVPDAQSLSAQSGVNRLAAANVPAQAVASHVVNPPQEPNSIVSSAAPTPVSDQSGKDAPRVEVTTVPLPQPQPPAQLLPQPQAQWQAQAQPQQPQVLPQAPQPQPSPTQPQAGPKGMHSQHGVRQGNQPAILELTLGESPADVLKSTAADILIRVSVPHRSVINGHLAGNAPSPKAEAATAAADSAWANSAPANSTTARDEDRKSGAPSGQTNPAPQNAPAATSAAAPATPATSAPVQPVVSQPANAPAPPPTGVPAAASQTLPASPLQTFAPRPGALDLPAAMPDPAVPVQVSAARIVQTESRAGMRLDMQTQSFGGVEVHTSIAGRDVQLSVSAEHGDLHSFLAPEMPVLQSQLQQHDLRLQQVRTVLNYGTQQEFSSGSGRHDQRFARPQTRPGAFDSHHMAASPDEEDSPKGLSIRI